MKPLHIMVMEPFQLIVDETGIGLPERMLWPVWLRRVGGIIAHGQMRDSGEMILAHHARYDRNVVIGQGVDDLGRRFVRIGPDFLMALAIGWQGPVSLAKLRRVFRDRECADAAWSDLWRWARTVQAMQSAIADDERDGEH